jgi:hypothetical protein
VWNEVIAFDIVHGRDNLLVEVLDRSDIGRDALIGKCEVNLNDLKD